MKNVIYLCYLRSVTFMNVETGKDMGWVTLGCTSSFSGHQITYTPNHLNCVPHGSGLMLKKIDLSVEQKIT